MHARRVAGNDRLFNPACLFRAAGYTPAMSFYGNRKRVDEFGFRSHRVEIYRARQGALHCGLDHEPHETACAACRTPIRWSTVFLISIDGQELEMPCTDAEEAADTAIAVIDNVSEDAEDEPSPVDPKERPTDPTAPAPHPTGKDVAGPIDWKMTAEIFFRGRKKGGT